MRGQLTCTPTRVGTDAITAGARLVIDGAPEGSAELVVRAARQNRGRMILDIDGVTTVEQAERYVGISVSIARTALNLAEGEYLDDDLVGLRLFDENGQQLGVVSAVRHFPAQDCLVVEPRGALVPMVREFILAVDLPEQRILVRLPPGLIDDTLAEKA